MQLDSLYAEIEAADKRIRQLVPETPLDLLVGITDDDSISVYAKLENLLPSGSFKLRGVTNKLCLLSEETRRQGVVAASSGNHGAALAYAIKHLGGRGIVFVPDYASVSKTRTIQALGAQVRYVSGDAVESEHVARQYAADKGLPYISPYNDEDVVAGQGTVACELYRQQVALDAVFIALGGGGLTSGVATYLKRLKPGVQIIACSPSNSKVMMESVKAGKILDLPSEDTFSDGTAGGVEENAITFDYCSRLIDQFIEVSEHEIASAVRTFIDTRRLLIEGAAGAALAAFLKVQNEWRNKNVAIVICGGNVSTDTLKKMLLA